MSYPEGDSGSFCALFPALTCMLRNSCRPLKRTRFLPISFPGTACRAFPYRRFAAGLSVARRLVVGLRFNDLSRLRIGIRIWGVDGRRDAAPTVSKDAGAAVAVLLRFSIHHRGRHQIFFVSLRFVPGWRRRSHHTGGSRGSCGDTGHSLGMRDRALLGPLSNAGDRVQCGSLAG